MILRDIILRIPASCRSAVASLACVDEAVLDSALRESTSLSHTTILEIARVAGLTDEATDAEVIEAVRTRFDAPESPSVECRQLGDVLGLLGGNIPDQVEFSSELAADLLSTLFVRKSDLIEALALASEIMDPCGEWRPRTTAELLNACRAISGGLGKAVDTLVQQRITLTLTQSAEDALVERLARRLAEVDPEWLRRLKDGAS